MLESFNDNPTVKKMQALLEQREQGTITETEYERRSRQLMIGLQQRADKEREKVKAWAIEKKKVRDAAEYKRLCAHYHDEYGDSFHNYLTSIFAGASFLTLNEKMLDDARLLEIRFGGHIVSPEQAAYEAEAEKQAADASQDDVE